MDAGIYDDLSNTAYHSETDWVSSSQLKAWLPEHFRGVGAETSAKDFGSAFHTTVLGVGEPIEFVDALTWQGKAAKEEQEAIRARGNTPLLKKDWPIIEGMALAVSNHSEANDLLHVRPGRPEVSVFADVDEIPCRARFDKITDDGIGIDLKSTTSQPGEFDLSRTVIRYGYELSADHYLRVAAAAGLDVDSFLLVFVGKDDPHYVTVVELDESFYNRAGVLRELALERVQHADMVGTYPGFEGRLNLSAPRWARL